MDDYLVKPVRGEIYDKIETLFAGRRPTAPVSAASAVASAEIAAPRRRPIRCPNCNPWAPRPRLGISAIAVVDGDRELLGEVVAAFLIEGPTLWEEYPPGLGGQRRQSLQLPAPTRSKGRLRTLGIELAAQFGERAGGNRPQRLPGAAPGHVVRLESQLDQIFSEAKSFASAPQTR